MVSGHSAQALPARLCLAPACEVEHHVVARGEHGLRMAAATDKFRWRAIAARVIEDVDGLRVTFQEDARYPDNASPSPPARG